MQFIEKDLQLNVPSVPEDSLFFDIETTGLSPRNSHIYLFGSAACSGGLWHFKQWLIENPHEERGALSSINDYITKFKTLIHFNGDRFDIPYVAGRCEFLGLPDVITAPASFDLFRALRKTRDLLGLPRAHQKNFEAFAGNVRLDKYDGGQLIKIYHEYQSDGSPDKLAALLLHNEEDVLGMPALLALLPYGALFDRASSLISSPPSVLPANDSGSLYLDFTPAGPFSFPLSRRVRFANVRLNGEHLGLRVPICRGCLKYFYPHARDYYYLPGEDMAVHKSVASYVDPAHRVKATAETCYIKKEAAFIKLPSPIAAEVFYENFGGEPYAEMTEALLSDTGFWNLYLHELFCNVPKQEL